MLTASRRRPMVVFSGTAFESPVNNEYTMFKSMITDMFKGEVSDKIDVEGLQYVVSVAADEPAGDEVKLPRVEVEEMGPRMDL